MDVSGVLNTLVPITQFNKGKASQLFSKAQNGSTLVVVRNNAPVAIVISPDEYELLRNLVKACNKASENASSSGFSASIAPLLSQIAAMDER